MKEQQPRRWRRELPGQKTGGPPAGVRPFAAADFEDGQRINQCEGRKEFHRLQKRQYSRASQKAGLVDEQIWSHPPGSKRPNLVRNRFPVRTSLVEQSLKLSPELIRLYRLRASAVLADDIL